MVPSNQASTASRFQRLQLPTFSIFRPAPSRRAEDEKRRVVARLVRLVRLVAFAVPAVLTLLALIIGGVFGVVAAGLAVAGAALGLVVERWLFFAEAKRTVTLYYGAEAV